MSEISPFVHADVPAVADLFMKVFRGSTAPAPESLRSCFRELYLNNPWNDGKFDSFVNRRPDGSVSGFIGALPRRMALRDREITVVVAGNHMVDQDRREPFVGSNLLKRLFSGPQDLTLTDSANETSKRLWEKMGAVTLLNYSLRWLRILRPVSYPLSLVGTFPGATAVRALLFPAAAAGDLMARKYLPPPVASTEEGLQVKAVTPDIIVSGIEGMAGSLPLRPRYDIGTLTWLLSMVRTKVQYGELKARALYSRGSLLGWYLYYGRPGGTAQVLQLAARPDTFARVFNHLLAGAYEEGSPAVIGMIDPRYLREYHANRCVVHLRDMYATAYAADPEVLPHLLAGRAFLSRLDGEWWTRLQGDRFE